MQKTDTKYPQVLDKYVKPDYYNAAAAMTSPRKFPSPVNDPDWLLPAASWFSEGKNCLEIGPGRGEFAKAALHQGKTMQRRAMEKYYIIDMSQGMLDLVSSRLKGYSDGVDLQFICSDIDKDELDEIPDRSVDRAIMVNVFQDLQPMKALAHLRRVMAPGGLLRVNMSDRGVRDSIRMDDEFFDRQTGCFYMTRPPLGERQGDVLPLGFLERQGKHVPFYRIIKSYYLDQIHDIFRRSGFEIIQEVPMILPKKVWMDCNEARYEGGISPKKMEILEQYGGYPGKLDVIARRSY